jgi:hypothetical protein
VNVRVVALTLAAATLAGAAPAAAAWSPWEGEAIVHPRTGHEFAAVVAQAAVWRSADQDPACNARTAPGDATDAPAPEGLLDAVGLFRGPPAAEPVVAAAGATTFAGQTHRVVLGTGRSVLVSPALVGPLLVPPSRACERRYLAEVASLTKRGPASIRRDARRLISTWAARARAEAARPRQPGVAAVTDVASAQPREVAADDDGAVTLATFARTGLVLVPMGSSNRATVVVVVPDRVATVRLTYGRHGQRQRAYRTVVRRTIRVADNAGATVVPRPFFDAWSPRQDWYAADGTHLRTVRP